MPHMMIPFERLWLIRSPSPGPLLTGRPTFWIAANEWNSSPAHATLFPTEEAAVRQIQDARYHKRAGFTGIVEAVPAEGALKTIGTVIEVRRALPPSEKGDGHG